MDTQEVGRERLKSILDLLGPGSVFQMDERWLKHAFGTDKQVAIPAVEQFAKENHCFCRYDAKTEICEFGRANFKSGDDV